MKNVLVVGGGHKYSRWLSIAVSFMLASTLISCGSDKTASDSSAQKESTSASVSEEEKTSINEENVIASNDSYTVITEKLGDGVFYPRIKGMSNESLMTELNNKLYSLEQERYEAMSDYTASPELLYSDETVLCINQVALFNGGGRSETVLSIDMLTGNELKLADVADIAELSEKLYNNDGIKVVSSDAPDASIADFIDEKRFASAEDIADYLETHGKFRYDKNKNVVIMFFCSSGVIEVTAE